MPHQNTEHARWFAEEVHPHEPALRRFLRGRFPNLRDIDDLIQETYVRCFRARALNKIEEPRAYLFATARNAALDQYRRNRTVTTESLGENMLESVVDNEPNAAESAINEQEKAILTQAIEELPARCREVLKLRRFQNLSYREIAEKLGISESTVNSQLAIAMLRCRQRLIACGISNRKHHVLDG